MMCIRQPSFYLLTFLLLGIFSVSAIASAPAPQPVADAYTLIAEVNALRAANGLPAYQINATLMAVAQAHSQYQANTGTVTHYSADGSRPYQRALAAGYPVGGNLSLGGYFSENIVAGNNMSSAEAVRIWQGDAPHLNTMLSPYLTEVGAGVAAIGNYVYYTLDASAPSGGTVTYSTPVPGETQEIGSGSGALPTLDWIMPVITSTPNESGEVIHVVQVGQNLSLIAEVYKIKLEDLRALNSLGENALLYPGDRLLIALLAPQEPPTPTATFTVEPSPTSIAISTEANIPTFEPTEPAPVAAEQKTTVESSGLMTVLIIILVALVMAGLATWLSGSERD